MLTTRNLIAMASIIAVVGAIIAGLVSIGSPGMSRAVRMDQERTNDIRELAQRITVFQAATGENPEDLEALLARDGVDENFNDPRTGEPYEYVDEDGVTFQLCAIFETDGPHELSPRYPYLEVHRPHVSAITIVIEGTGRQCFEFGPQQPKTD